MNPIEERMVLLEVKLGKMAFGTCQRVSHDADAVKIGTQVEQSGIYEHFPIAGISLNDVRVFGARLRMYGEDGK